MPEPRCGTEVSCPDETRLNVFEVAVVAKYLYGAPHCRVDSTVRSLRHRVGDFQRFEEQRGDLDAASRAGMEGRKF